MSKKKKKAKEEPLNKKRNVKLIAQSVVAVVLVAGVSFTAFKILTGTKHIEHQDRGGNIASVTETQQETLPFQFVYEQHSNEDIYDGDLILVNNSTEYKAQGKENLVSIYDEKNSLHPESENGDTAFGVTDSSLSLRKNAADNLTAMLDAFYAATGKDDVVVCSGYRTKEGQQALYDDDLEKTGLDYSERVALPGYSEHEAGYSVDLTLAEAEYDGTGDYNWINENCSDYGFILRYPEDKTDITQIEYESWHYRYVGVPHAEYIMESGMCLEEYIDMLKNSYEVSSDRTSVLEYTAKDGKIYDIYYVKADTSSDSTYVPFPSGYDYSISGNNTDGFVIWFDTGKTGTHTSLKDVSQSTESSETSASENSETETVAAETSENN